MKEEWRPILKLRSHQDKIGIPVDLDLLEVSDLDIVSELVREGYMVWIDRTVLRHLVLVHKETDRTIIGINADIYQLTLKGIQLCNANGIEQQ